MNKLSKSFKRIQYLIAKTNKKYSTSTIQIVIIANLFCLISVAALLFNIVIMLPKEGLYPLLVGFSFLTMIFWGIIFVIVFRMLKEDMKNFIQEYNKNKIIYINRKNKLREAVHKVITLV